MHTEQNELTVSGETALVTPEVQAAAGGSPAPDKVFYPDTDTRQWFETWVRGHTPTAEFTRNENGEYIVLGMHSEYLAFVAGWATRDFVTANVGGNATGDGAAGGWSR